MANCRYCNKEISWLKDGRKNIPVEIDGSKHECENLKQARGSYRKIDPSELDPEILKQYEENMRNATKKKK